MTQGKRKKEKLKVVSKHVLHVTITEEERKKEHEQLVVTLQADYVCYDCGVEFGDQDAYKKHEEKHSPTSGDVKCEICGIYRSSAKTMYYHRLQHYRRFRCAICKVTFKDREKTHQHVVNLHPEETRYDYGKIKKSVEKNVKRKRKKTDQYFSCPHCESFYKSEAYMQLHVRTVHKITGKWLACNCGRVFPNRSRLNDHKANVHGDAYKENVCVRCGKAFKTRSLLNRHQSVHSTETYPCPECDASFRSREYVRVHYKMKHLNMTRAEIRASTKKYRPLWVHDVRKKGKILFENEKEEDVGTSETIEATIKNNLKAPEPSSPESRKCICDHCGKEYPTKTILKRHMYVHMDLIFPCTICEAEFKSPCNLKKHYRRTHKLSRGEVRQRTENDGFLWGQDSNDSGQNAVENGQDSVGTSQAVDSMIENVKFSEPKIYPCDECGKCYQSKTLLKRHKLVHTEEQFPCNECGAAFKTPGYLRTHVKRRHLDKAPSELIATIENIQNNVDNLHNFDTSEAFRTMIEESIRVDAAKKFACDECGKRYQTKTQLRRHQISHTEQTYPCTECGAVFRAPDYLKKHYKRHLLNMTHNHFISGPIVTDLAASASKIYSCNDCGKEFKGKSTLKRHLQLVHTDITFPCNECGQRFKTREYVKVHHKIKHLNMSRAEIKAQSKRGDSTASEEPPPRKHICSYCDKAYPTNALLKRHTHVHMNETYPCNVCERTFQTLEYLRHHLKTKKHLKMSAADIQTEFKTKTLKKALEIKEEVVFVEKDPLACDDEFDDDDDLNLVDVIATQENAV